MFYSVYTTLISLTFADMISEYGSFNIPDYSFQVADVDISPQNADIAEPVTFDDDIGRPMARYDPPASGNTTMKGWVAEKKRKFRKSRIDKIFKKVTNNKWAKKADKVFKSARSCLDKKKNKFVRSVEKRLKTAKAQAKKFQKKVIDNSTV